MSTASVRKSKHDGFIKINQYIVEKTLGKGSFATVKLCRDSVTNEKYAVKQMNKRVLQKKQCGGGKSAYDCVVEELKVLKTLDHPNVIWLHEIIDDPKKDNIYLVTHFLQKGSLGNLTEQKNEKYKSHNILCKQQERFSEMKYVGLNLNSIRLYLIDMLKALHYCHKVAKVIHRDIKPDNIVINHNDEAVLIDFGVSVLVHDLNEDFMENNMGSYLFFAPEMFTTGVERKQVRGEMTDLWALGITFYYLSAGKYPCGDATNPIQLKEFVIQRDIDFEIIKNEPLRNLLKSMLQKNPSQRATLDMILKDPWLTKNGQKDIEFSTVSQFQNGANGFGNLDRLINLQMMSKGTQKNVFQSKISSLNVSTPRVTEINQQSQAALNEINEQTVE